MPGWPGIAEQAHVDGVGDGLYEVAGAVVHGDRVRVHHVLREDESGVRGVDRLRGDVTANRLDEHQVPPVGRRSRRNPLDRQGRGRRGRRGSGCRARRRSRRDRVARSTGRPRRRWGSGLCRRASGEQSRDRDEQQRQRRAVESRRRDAFERSGSRFDPEGLALHASRRPHQCFEPLGGDGAPALVADAVGVFFELLERPVDLARRPGGARRRSPSASSAGPRRRCGRRRACRTASGRPAPERAARARPAAQRGPRGAPRAAL